tara:strand:- start:17333 stop:18460 length:1128 start_codon:yes stop_codon:yes gene_type:complete
MNVKQIIIFFICILVNTNSFSQVCEIDSINYNHIDCYGESTGSISVKLLQPDSVYQKTYWWTGPDGFYANQTLNISNLKAGDYVLTIIANIVPGDPSTPIWDSNLEGDSLGGAPMDTIRIYENLQIGADIIFTNLCNKNDSASVVTQIYGGTPPYSTLWSNGDTARNTSGLLQNTTTPYTLTISDKNNCITNIDTVVPSIREMNILMSNNVVSCKDDSDGWVHARVYNGTPPYSFMWSNGSNIIDRDSSSIRNLTPAIYFVDITDSMGCIDRDSVNVLVNPANCIKVYDAFSPNDDDVNEFWKINNIDVYPQAIVLVYDRNGKQVYRRRNYKNTYTDAFSGRDQKGKILASGNYYYIIDLGNSDKVIKGIVTIVR